MYSNLRKSKASNTNQIFGNFIIPSEHHESLKQTARFKVEEIKKEQSQFTLKVKNKKIKYKLKIKKPYNY